jgi:HEAT repeat protein
VFSLSFYSFARAIDVLIELSKDKESYWRYEAEIALERIKTPKVIQALKRALKDEDQEVRKKAEKALRGLGE